jgi:hypothetical protein
MVSGKPKDHSSERYFCLTDTSGISSKSKYMVTYPNLPSAMRPPNNVTMDKDNSDADEVHPDQVGERNDNDPTHEQWSILKNYFITHADLNYFVLNLKLSKNQAEILALRLKGCNLFSRTLQYVTARTAWMN